METTFIELKKNREKKKKKKPALAERRLLSVPKLFM